MLSLKLMCEQQTHTSRFFKYISRVLTLVSSPDYFVLLQKPTCTQKNFSRMKIDLSSIFGKKLKLYIYLKKNYFSLCFTQNSTDLLLQNILLFLIGGKFKCTSYFIYFNPIKFVLVQLCWKVVGTQGELNEKTPGRNLDKDGCIGSRLYEG